MRSVVKYVVAVLAGASLGLIGARFVFVGSGLSLIPWAIVGLGLGAWCTRRESLGVGAAYGFSLAFVFMVAGYEGRSPLTGRLPAFALLGLVGAVCGMALAMIGSLSAHAITSRRQPK